MTIRYIALATMISTAAWAGSGSTNDQLRLDAQGRGVYSHYNFTDIKNPYDGFDAFVELKPAYWFDQDQQVGIYASLLPVYTTEDEFWFQRNVQYGVGLQAYPVGRNEERPLARGLRFFALAAWREYYDKGDNEEPEDSDLQAGADYYYDSLYDTNKNWAVAAYATAAYRDTNFSEDDYAGLLSFGNIQFGPKTEVGSALLMGYGLLDWSVSPSHDDRWWENYVRLGAGVRIHPLAARESSRGADVRAELQKRFSIFAEYVSNSTWLGDDPPTSVEEEDYRIGIAFSTGGYFR